MFVLRSADLTAALLSSPFLQVKSTRSSHDTIQILKSDDVNRDSVTSIRYRPRARDSTQNLLLACCGSLLLMQVARQF